MNLSPSPAMAGTLAMLAAIALLRSPRANEPTRRPRSGGIRAMSTPTSSRNPATAAGMTVSSIESLPGSTPVRSRIPQTISATG